jgi:nucleoid DNA-binding protein
LAGRLAKLGDTKFRLSPELLRPVLADNRADIEWMEARLATSLDEQLGEHRLGDVREEWDLLRPDPEVIGRLRTMLGDAAPKGVKGETPEEVAQLVHAARLLGEENTRKRRNFVRGAAGALLTRATAHPLRAGGSATNGQAGAGESLDTLFDELEHRDPGVLNSLSRTEAQAFVRSAFAHMNETLLRAQDSVIDYEGLGQFRVSSGAGRAGAQESRRKRIVFRPSPPAGQ